MNTMDMDNKIEITTFNKIVRYWRMEVKRIEKENEIRSQIMFI